MLFNAEPLAQCGYGTAVSWAPPSAHITEPPAELLVSVCLKTQAPSIVAKGVLKVKGQRCPPPPIIMALVEPLYILSCGLGE